MMGVDQYPRSSGGGTTVDGVLDALISLTGLMGQVIEGQHSAMTATAAGSARSDEMCDGLAAVRAAVLQVREAVTAATPGNPQRVSIVDSTQADLLKELKAHTVLLTEIKAQLAKGLLVKTVLSL